MGAGQFVAVVVSVGPDGAVFQRGLLAPVGRVVEVAVRGDHRPVGLVGNRGKPEAVVPRAGRRQHRGGAVAAGRGLQQVRVWQVAVRGGEHAVRDPKQPSGAGVIAIIVLEKGYARLAEGQLDATVRRGVEVVERQAGERAVALPGGGQQSSREIASKVASSRAVRDSGWLAELVLALDNHAGRAVGIVGAGNLAVIVDCIGDGDAPGPRFGPGRARLQIVVRVAVPGGVVFREQQPSGGVIVPECALIGHAHPWPTVCRGPGNATLKGPQFGQFPEAVIDALLRIRHVSPNMLRFTPGRIIVKVLLAVGVDLALV